MLVGFFSVLIMLLVAYAHLREGLFTAFIMCVNTIISGLIAFNFWEPLARSIEPTFSGIFLAGFEDFLCMVGLFALSLGLLRTLTNYMVPAQVRFPPMVQRPGGFVFGLFTGYFASGFLVCALQTLPWHENFMTYDAGLEGAGEGSGTRRFLPPDRAFLAMMSYAGAVPFSADEDKNPRFKGSTDLFERYKTFDKYATYSLRYAYYRRYGDSREPWPYQGEFDIEIYKKRS